jgi:hypothetical protein
MRLEIFQRDMFSCRECGATEKSLHVHHCLYVFGADPWEYKPDDLLTLCADCHSERGDLEQVLFLEFRRLMATRCAQSLNDLICDVVELRAAKERHGEPIKLGFL